MRTRRKNLFQEESGSVAALVAISLGVILGFLALSLDISHLNSTIGELQKAAEAGALAGVRGLYPDNIFVVQDSMGLDFAQANTRAVNAVMQNQVDGTLVRADEASVQFGVWNYSTQSFSPGNISGANAARVMTRRDQIKNLFARIFGINAMNQSATATAVMDWIKGVPPGTLPIAVNEDYARSGQAHKITFNPSTSDVGGWFAVPPDDSTSASTLNEYIDNGTCPPIKMGDIIDLSNGVVESVLKNLLVRLAEHGGTWDTCLPLVDSTQFNENKPIVGFLTFRITEVAAHGNDKYVEGIPMGLGIGPGGAIPGGGSFGVLAPPRLVK